MTRCGLSGHRLGKPALNVISSAAAGSSFAAAKCARVRLLFHFLSLTLKLICCTWFQPKEPARSPHTSLRLSPAIPTNSDVYSEGKTLLVPPQWLSRLPGSSSTVRVTELNLMLGTVSCQT